MKKNDQINSATAFSPPALLPPRRIALSSPLRPQHAPLLPRHIFPRPSHASHSQPLAPANFPPRLPFPAPCSGKLPPPLRPNRALTRH